MAAVLCRRHFDAWRQRCVGGVLMRASCAVFSFLSKQKLGRKWHQARREPPPPLSLFTAPLVPSSAFMSSLALRALPPPVQSRWSRTICTHPHPGHPRTPRGEQYCSSVDSFRRIVRPIFKCTSVHWSPLVRQYESTRRVSRARTVLERRNSLAETHTYIRIVVSL